MPRLIVFVPAAGAVAATSAAKVLDPTGGANTFNTPLNATGKDTDVAAGFWCCWQLTPAQQTQFQGLLGAIPGVTFHDREAVEPTAVLAGKSLKSAAPDLAGAVVAQGGAAKLEKQ